MASLRKKKDCKFWFACFTLPDGRRVQRSTRKENRKDAQRVADEWEILSKQRAETKQFHKVAADIFKSAHGSTLPASTARSFLNGWVKLRRGELAETSRLAYERTGKIFLDWLGKRADDPIADLRTRDIVEFRNAQVDRVAATTVNKYIKHLRIAFESARRDGYVSENPAKDCATLKRARKSQGEQRRPLTVDEIRRVLEIASAEWRSLIFFGLYTGQRLGDLKHLSWANIDTVANEIHLTTSKTGRVVRIPICKPLANHIATLEVSDDPNASIHPVAAATTTPTLSNSFAKLLGDAGVIAKRSHQKQADGRGRDFKRAASEVSFHSLRHSATSLMKNAGVSPAIVQDIIGHESAAVSANYTHVESEAKLRALDSMPDLMA